MSRILIAALLLASGQARSSDAFPAEKVIAGITGDWNKDGLPDLALLVAPLDDDSDIGLYLYLHDADHALLRLAASAPGFVWGNSDPDGVFGQDPTIEALSNGSIVVHSENSGIGRNRWEKLLTIAYREQGFVVAGFTYNYYDTLDLDDSGDCDYNVLNGKFVKNEVAGRTEPRSVAIGDWSDSIGLSACGLE